MSFAVAQEMRRRHRCARCRESERHSSASPLLRRANARTGLLCHRWPRDASTSTLTWRAWCARRGTPPRRRRGTPRLPPCPPSERSVRPAPVLAEAVNHGMTPRARPRTSAPMATFQNSQCFVRGDCVVPCARDVSHCNHTTRTTSDRCAARSESWASGHVRSGRPKSRSASREGWSPRRPRIWRNQVVLGL
jgi:hypothetical protein